MTQLTDLFLIASLFLPRISLLVVYMQGSMPPNPTPFIVDVLLTMVMPRILVLILIVVTQGFTGWFWLHFIVALLLSGGYVSDKSSD